MKEKLSRSAGLTLKEILVIIVIIVVAVFLLKPLIQKGAADAASAACNNNLRKIGMALQMYANDYDEFLPPAQWCGKDGFVTWREILGEYPDIKDEVFVCKARKGGGVGFAVNYKTFRINVRPTSANITSLKDIKDPENTIYALDTGFVTDETKNLPPDQWVEDTSREVRSFCRCSKYDKYWSEDPCRPMPRHRGKVNCVMANGSVKSFTADQIINPNEKDENCLWDRY